MTSYLTQNVIGDVGSQELAQLMSSYNNLLDVLGVLVTALKTAADFTAVNNAATAAETSLQANVKKLQSLPNIPLNPARAAV